MKTLVKLILTIILIVLMYKGIVYFATENVYTVLISIPCGGLVLVTILEKMFKQEMKRIGNFLTNDEV